jgi:hypothetical protein
VSISEAAVAKIRKIGPVLVSMTEPQIDADVRNPLSQLRRNVLLLRAAGEYESFYAPFDWVNDQADVVIVGVTPGLQQASEALISLRRALAAGSSVVDAARAAKQAASFKGTMRTLGARLMDHFDLHLVFNLTSTLELFGIAANRAHYTSVIRYPVTKKGKNYSGDARLLNIELLRSIVDEHLASELALFPAAWIVPFGPTAHRVIDVMVERRVLSADRVFGGILHPSGTQWNRYKVQLGLVSESEAQRVPGGLEVLRRSAQLRTKVAGVLSGRRSQSAAD